MSGAMPNEQERDEGNENSGTPQVPIFTPADSIALFFLYMVTCEPLKADPYENVELSPDVQPHSYEQDLDEMTPQEQEDLAQIMHNNICVARLYAEDLSHEMGCSFEDMSQLIDQVAEIVERNVVRNIAAIKQNLRRAIEQGEPKCQIQ
ncbi:hypothetical protein QR680_000828 [Steinernema hermaphroditum]|uniref:Uncharacterized protein n=1 Tax=Steinernema hermaphroditum TaxID=289476 RepID=A0AA39GW06_9BILA|nr:hypothetical protein QR680_000828 [Steinernema hermaphroditum]